MNFSAFLVWNYSWANPFASCIKEIQDSHGFWIPRRGFLIPDLFQWNSDSGFQLSVGFQIPTAVFRIPLAKIFWIPESGFPYMYKGIQDSLGFWIPDSSYWIPDLFLWNLDSALQMSVGFQIPTAVFRFPRDRSPDSKSKNFLDSGIRIPLHWTKSIRVINSGMPSTFQILLTI